MAEEAEERYKVPLFDGTNYENWKFRMECLLDEKELLTLVNSEPVYDEPVADETMAQATTHQQRNQALKRKDKKCKNLIVQKIAESHIEYAINKDSAYKVWKHLEATFKRKSVVAQMRLRTQLLTWKHNPNKESMQEHFQKFDHLVRQLKAAGGNVDEGDVMVHLLLSLPQEYNVVSTAI
jgi:hypothetical protein